MIKEEEAVKIANAYIKESEYAKQVEAHREPELRTVDELKKIFGDEPSDEFKNVIAAFKEHWIVQFPFITPDTKHVVDAVCVIVDHETGEAEFQLHL